MSVCFLAFTSQITAMIYFLKGNKLNIHIKRSTLKLFLSVLSIYSICCHPCACLSPRHSIRKIKETLICWLFLLLSLGSSIRVFFFFLILASLSPRWCLASPCGRSWSQVRRCSHRLTRNSWKTGFVKLNIERHRRTTQAKLIRYVKNMLILLRNFAHQRLLNRKLIPDGP